MNTQNKTHYRKVFKSDHLGSADLEDLIEQKAQLIFTIKEVKQEYNVSVAGKKGNYNIAYFNESIKPLVLNATNSKVVKGFANNSPFVEDWKNILIELYIDENVKQVGGGTGQGVRIRQTQPQIRTKQPFTTDLFEKAFKAGATIETIQTKYTITDEIKQKYIEYATDNS